MAHFKLQKVYLDEGGTENHLKKMSNSWLNTSDLCIDKSHVGGEGGHYVASLLVLLLTIKMNSHDLLNCCARKYFQLIDTRR